jgi:heptosyltransferase II
LDKILIIQTAFIGDVVLATPVAEKLHKDFPGADIDFLLREGTEQLFSNHPFLKNIIVWNRKENKYKNLFKIYKQIRQNKYDLIVNLHRFGSSGFITAFSNAGRTIGFNKNPFSIFFSKRVKHIIGKKNILLHEIDRNLALISEYNDQSLTMPCLYPAEKDFLKFQDKLSTTYICIAPASVWYTKQFPRDKWIEFIKKIPDSIHVCYIGAANDRKLCKELIDDTKCMNSTNFAGELSLLETAALMKTAKMNFVNDSAPLHIASSMNAPVSAIFCSTIPAFGFGPLSENSNIFETEKILECRPCGLHGLKICPENHFECAYTIDTDKMICAILN